MADHQKIYAVLTGDLIKSSRLTSDQSKGAMESLKKAADEFSAHYPNTVIGRMDSFRHDSWQLLMEQPALSLRAALFFRTAIKLSSDAHTKYDTRISIGMGSVETISKRRISDSRGPAFTFSGKGMDALNGECLSFSAGDTRSDFVEAFEKGVVPLIDCIVGDWTPTESRAVNGALKGWTQEKIAHHWPVQQKTGKQPTRQAIGDSLTRACWSTLNTVLDWIEIRIKQAI